MNRKTITEEYYVLAVDKNGAISSIRSNELNSGLIASGLMDLMMDGVITIEKNKITVVKDLPEGLKHLKSLYTYLTEKNRTTEKVMGDYVMSMGARMREFIGEIGETLVAEGLAEKGKGGLFGPKVTYIPVKSYKDQLIEAVKNIVKTKDEFSPRDMAFLCILQETHNLNQYFSKYESQEIKDKLKEIKKNPQNKQLAEMVNYVNSMTAVIAALTVTTTV